VRWLHLRVTPSLDAHQRQLEVLHARQMLNQFSGVVMELEPNKSEQPYALESNTATGNVIRVPALKSHIPISREARLTKEATNEYDG
jgi:hypothetical protein